MPKFMMVYKGDATDMADMSEEEASGVTAKWGVWMEKVGPALTELGLARALLWLMTGHPGAPSRSPGIRSSKPPIWQQPAAWPMATRISAMATATMQSTYTN